MKKFKIIFLVAGFGFFVFLLCKVGFANIVDSFRLVGWRFVIIFAIQLVWFTFMNFAWAVEMRGTYHDVGFLSLYKARLAGEALNSLIPLGNFGGEPVKAYLLKDKASRTEIVASLILDKTIFSIGSILYILMGLIVAVVVLGVFSTKQKLVIILTLALMVWGLVVFIRRKDFFTLVFEKLKKMGIATTFISQKMEAINRMDSRIASFYRANKRRFLASVLLHFLGRFTGAIEFFLVFSYLNLDLGFAHALCINSLAIIINTLFFFMPGHWGIAEGAQGFIFLALGLKPSDGIAVGFVRRVKTIFWILVGLAIFFFSDPLSRKAAIEDITGENEA